MIAWDILIANSSALPTAIAWVHLNSQVGSVVYAVATEAMTSELAAIEGVAPIKAIAGGAELSSISTSGSVSNINSVRELGALDGSS